MRKYYCGLKRTWKIRCLYHLWGKVDNLASCLFNRRDDQFGNICMEECDDRMTEIDAE